MRVGTIAEIWRYPVKSMGGESIDASPVGDLGIFGDRAYALRDDEAGEIRGAKKIPGLLHFASRYLGTPTDGYSAAPVEITTPDGALIGSGDDDASSLLSAAIGRPVTLSARPDPEADLEHYKSGAKLFPDNPMKEGRLLLGLEEDDEFPDLSGLPADGRGFASFPGTYFDAFQLHLITSASFAEAQRLNPDANFDVRRFRPNLVLKTDDSLSGFVESDWAGKTLSIGDVRIDVVTSTVRCAMPMQSQSGLEFDKSTLRTLIDHHGQHLGAYCSVAAGGEIHVGDEVRLD